MINNTLLTINLVIVSESLSYIGSELRANDRKLDRPNSYSVSKLVDTFSEVVKNVFLYESPQEFEKKLHLHRDDLVLPYWFGENSRNRHSLVPAICEANNIKYVGGDVYTKVLCNDKEISKFICKKASLNVAKHILIHEKSDIDKLSNLNFPCVVKPIYEGTSLGISSNNLVKNISDAVLVINEILAEFNQPAMVEEHIFGKEISICFLGWKNNIVLWNAAERYIVDNETYFFNHLYTHKEKKSKELQLSLRSVKEQISEELFNNCKKIFCWLDKVEYIRIDGKLDRNKFTVIELTPETHLGYSAEFCGTLALEGYSYAELLSKILTNCLERYRNLDSN